MTLNNIKFYFNDGGAKEQAAREVPALIDSYPDPNRWGVTLAYAFFIRNVKDIKLNNIEVSYLKEDLRPALILDNVDGADFQHIRAQKAKGAPILMLNQMAITTLL